MTASLETLMGRILGAGVAVSTALLAVGLALTLLAPGPIASRLLDAGILVLMATPATRVVLACAEFTRKREWFFALASLGVLAVLATTVWVAFYGR